MNENLLKHGVMTFFWREILLFFDVSVFSMVLIYLLVFFSITKNRWNIIISLQLVMWCWWVWSSICPEAYISAATDPIVMKCDKYSFLVVPLSGPSWLDFPVNWLWIFMFCRRWIQCFWWIAPPSKSLWQISMTFTDKSEYWMSFPF